MEQSYSKSAGNLGIKRRGEQRFVGLDSPRKEYTAIAEQRETRRWGRNRMYVLKIRHQSVIGRQLRIFAGSENF